MTTLAVDSPLVLVTGDFNSIGIIADDQVFEGAMVGENASGYGRPLVAGDLFLGHSLLNVDNSDGLAGAKEIRLRTGRYRGKVSISGILITDVGKEVYASDDATYTLSSAGNTRVGVVIRYNTSSTAIVEFQTNEPGAEGGGGGVGGDDHEVTYGDLEIGGSYQATHALDTTQNYPIGARRRTLINSDAWRYYKAANTLKTQWGAKCWAEEAVKWASVQADAAAGVSSVNVTVAATDGIAVLTGKDNSGNIALNELRGGSVCFYQTGADLVRENHRITGNTAVTGGGTMTITLARPLGIPMTTSSFVEIMGNPYRNVFCTNDGHTSVMGIPERAATIGQFGWMKTWGMFCLSPGGTGLSGNGVGSTGEEREVVFGGNGCLFERNVGDSCDQRQRAGFIVNMGRTASGGPPFIELQISP